MPSAHTNSSVEQDHVAQQHVRGGEAGHLVEREIPRLDAEQHSDGLVDEFGGALVHVELTGTEELGSMFGVVVEDRRRQVHLGASLRDQLAHLPRHRRRQVVLAFAHEFGGAGQHVRTAFDGFVAPQFECGGGSLHDLVELLPDEVRVLPDRPSGVRVDGAEGRRVGAGRTGGLHAGGGHALPSPVVGGIGPLSDYPLHATLTHPGRARRRALDQRICASIPRALDCLGAFLPSLDLGDLLPDEAHIHPELDHEQGYVSMLYERLDGLRTYASDRLSRVLLEGGGTPQARSERESFTQMYTEDLARYDAAENGLCFGRIDVDGEPRYVGRVGILDEDGDYETLLLDWRAPLARPFYLATPAAPEGVTRRRHIRTRRRTVTAINDEYLDLDAARAHGDGGGAGGVAGESALLAALNAARTGQMHDIVETIQSEQDAIIRSNHRSVLVVQGGPGTGKTAVALHRAAYLLYTYRQQLDRAGVLIIGPNATFLDYIGQVLPSLGETGVLLSTIGDLYPGVRATREDSLEEGELKGSLAMIDVLKKAVRDRQEVPKSPIELRFDTYPITLDRKIVTRARGRARSSRRPHNLARPIFVSAAIEALADQLAATLGATCSTARTCSAATTSPTCATRCAKTQRSWQLSTRSGPS